MTKRVALRLDRDLLDQVAGAAERDDRTIAYKIRECLRATFCSASRAGGGGKAA
jgi:hypothetical protein